MFKCQTWDSPPYYTVFIFVGVEVLTPPSTGKLTMYTLPTNYADNEINILGSAIDVEVQIKNEGISLCLFVRFFNLYLY